MNQPEPEKQSKNVKDRINEDPKTIAQRINASSKARREIPSKRLEILLDKKNNLVIIQGDETGIFNLIDMLMQLVRPGSFSGQHYHLDDSSVARADIDIILQRVDNNDKGSHTISTE